MLIYPIKTDELELSLILSEYQDFVWLDSANGSGFSVMAFGSSKQRCFTTDHSTQEFLEFLDNYKTFKNSDSQKVTQSKNLQFTGGWIGYISYEAFQFNDLIPIKPSKTKKYPLAAFRYYDTFIYIDHQKGEKYFVSLSNEAEHKWQAFNDHIQYRKNLSKTTADFISKNIKTNITHKKYEECFQEIKESLISGDYFELNFTMEFQGEFSGSHINLYHKLRKITQAPMMSYMDFPELKILSASPERFFKIKDHNIHCYPVKGTIKRGDTQKQDETNKIKLLKSDKDQAELLMVTDMLRNDLGRFCQTGSVKVEELVHVHTFSHYHHLISEIEGKLDEDYRFSDVFRGLFPGGSITGAPKIKVMEHIDKLENRARGVYTGAIGYMSNNGIIDFNIPIRTMTIQDEQLSFATGGGIVADSECEAEYDECMVKAAGIVEALNSK